MDYHKNSWGLVKHLDQWTSIERWNILTSGSHFITIYISSTTRHDVIFSSSCWRFLKKEQVKRVESPQNLTLTIFSLSQLGIPQGYHYCPAKNSPEGQISPTHSTWPLPQLTFFGLVAKQVDWLEVLGCHTVPVLPSSNIRSCS